MRLFLNKVSPNGSRAKNVRNAMSSGDISLEDSLFINHNSKISTLTWRISSIHYTCKPYMHYPVEFAIIYIYIYIYICLHLFTPPSYVPHSIGPPSLLPMSPPPPRVTFLRSIRVSPTITNQ